MKPRNSYMSRGLALLAACVVSGAIASAQENKDAKERDPKALEYEKLVKDLKKYPGAFTVYQRKREILLEIPQDKLDKLFYVQAAFHHGFSEDPVQAGSPIGGDQVDLFKFVKKGEDVWLVRPNLKYRWDKDDPLAIGASRSMPEAILSDYSIEGENPETKKILINMGTFFNGDLQQLPMLVAILGGNQYSLDRDKSGLDKVTQGGDNTTLRFNMTYFSPRPGGMDNPFAALLGGFINQAEDNRSLPIKVTWTLRFKPENSTYMPRLADPRIGYFTADHYDFDRFSKPDRTTRKINRFHLEKKDPNAAMSEPVKPIVWTIDHSIPAKWRPAMRDGILRWNKAFEALGYKNAIQVVDAPNSEDYDHADGRQNVVRMSVTEGSAYAIALFRTDPTTGEIINASVNMDANFLQYMGTSYLREIIPGSTAMKAQMDYIKTGWTQPWKNGLTPEKVMLDAKTLMHDHKSHELQKCGWRTGTCDVAAFKGKDLAYRMAQFKAAGINISSDKVLEMFLADVVCHEVGHCLGLRHNFVSSTNLTTAQLADPKVVQANQVAASVMEYTPTNVQAILAGAESALFNNGVGSYDMLAIRYGYSPKMATTPEGERFGLAQIARNQSAPGNGFMSDEDADGPDPYVRRFDNAKDPVNYFMRENVAARRTKAYAIANMPRNGESYADRNLMILISQLSQLQNCARATGFIGGVVGNRNFKGDVNEKPTLRPVDPAVSRQAMAMIAKDGLGMTSMDLPESILQNLSLDYASGQGNAFTAPIRTLMLNNQVSLLLGVIGLDTLNNVLENQFKFADERKAYTLDEHYAAVESAVMGDLGKAAIPSIRRDLQAIAVDGMIAQAGISGEIGRVAMDNLMKTKARAQTAVKAGTGTPTGSHARAILDRIARFENRIAISN